MAGALAYLACFQVAPSIAQIGWYLLLLAWMVANLRTRGVGMAAVGALSNLVVLVVNAGHMPFYGAAAPDYLHVPADASTQLGLLSDRILLPGPFPTVLMSIGDLLIVCGATWLLIAGLCAEDTDRGGKALAVASGPALPGLLNFRLRPVDPREPLV